MTNASDWRERGPAASRRAFYQWQAQHRVDTDLGQAFDAGFARGARWATSMTSSLSPAVAQLVEFVQWLRDYEQEQRAYDWALSNAAAEEHALVDDQEQEALPF